MDCGDKDMNGAWMTVPCHREYHTMIPSKCQSYHEEQIC